MKTLIKYQKWTTKNPFGSRNRKDTWLRENIRWDSQSDLTSLAFRALMRSSSHRWWVERIKVVQHHIHLPSFPPQKSPFYKGFSDQIVYYFIWRQKAGNAPIITAPWNDATSSSPLTKSRPGTPSPGNTARPANWCSRTRPHYYAENGEK